MPVDLQRLFRLDDQVAIVTGASSGLGERFARVLHEAGATVVLAARRVERLEKLAADLGGRAHPCACDVTNAEDRIRLVSSTIERFGAVDVLVNNAGTVTIGPAEDASLDEFRSTIETNLVSVFHLSQLAGRDMLGRGHGAIVNVASMLGMVAGSPMKVASYCASKGGVLNLTRELGVQWAGRGVRVNALAPGFFNSEMTEEIWADERSKDFVLRGTPARREGTAEELDAAILLLAGAGNSYMNGQTIVIDGGWTAR